MKKLRLFVEAGAAIFACLVAGFVAGDKVQKVVDNMKKPAEA